MRVIINMRDLLTWPREMAARLAADKYEVFLLDNESTYPPLLEWYKTCPYPVIRTWNIGHLAPWCHGATRHLMLDEPFAVTDPDLDISGVPPDWFARALDVMRMTGETKVGLSIDTSKVPADSFLRRRGRPTRFDTADMDQPVLPLPVDTTLAVYASRRGASMDGVSMGRPYSAIHLPWQFTPETLTDEYRYYIAHAGPSSQLSAYLKSL